MCTMITLLTMRLFFVCCTIFSVQCINVDDKLDFDNSPSFIGNSRYTNKANFVPIKVTKTVSSVKPGDNFENIGVVCVTGGCNKTTTSEDTIQTDVFVHIETKVDLKKNESSSNGPPEDISDVPVVVGFAGAKLDPTPEDEITQKMFIDSGSNRGRSFTNSPNYIPKIDILESEVQNGGRNIYNLTNYGKIYSLGTPERTANSPSFAPLSARNGISYENSIRSYLTNPKTVTNINIAGVATQQEDNHDNVLNTKYQNNHTPLTVPYFEPSYHNHYYGESPPPQFVWYPRNMNMPFKVMTPGRSESVWFKNNAHRHVASTTGTGQEVKCFCQRDNGDVKIRNGLNWYPSVKRSFNNDPGSQINDPGSQINDKLAPLN